MLAERKAGNEMKRKWDWGSAAMRAMLFLMGMALGFTVIADLNERGEQSLGAHLFSVVWLAMAAVLALFGQLILHEGGHLVCGLATGYRFVSFRIGSWMLQREQGKLRVRKFTLAGTGGQCLLAPPPLTDGKMPCVLYNLGGPLANLITALLCVLGMHFCRENWPLWVLLQLFAIVGIGMGLTNGIPLRGSVHNDSANALSLGKDPAALRSLWVQLSVNAQQAESVRLNTGAYAVMPLYNNMLLCDRLYCALLRGEDAYKWLAEWETKPMRQFRKQMADYLTVLRTEYAAALHAGDMQTAEAFRVRFEVRASSYPYPAEVQSERELIERFAQ